MATAADFTRLRSSVAADATGKGLYERVLSKANAIVAQPVIAYDPQHPERLYDASQAIWDRVTTLALSWQLSKNNSYAERLWIELSNAANFPNWNPSHFLDTATLSQAVGLGYDWLYEYWTPERRQVLSGAVVSKGLNPALSQYKQNAAWTKQVGNWNVVSNSGLGLAALAVRDIEPVLADSVLDYSVASIQNGLKGYVPDGGYREGLQYWGYATQNLVQYGMALRSATGNDQGILGSDAVKSSGQFPLYLTGPSGQGFNYSDSKNSELPPALGAMGGLYDNPVYTKMAYDTALKGNINQFALLWYRPGAAQKTAVQGNLGLDRYFRGAEVATMRSAWEQSDATFVALKAATTADNGHPHLDAGSFVLDALGVNWASELGPDNYGLPGYTDGLATGGRWNYYRTRAEGSNTVVLNPGMGPDQNPTSNSVIERTQSSASKALAVANLDSVNPAGTTWKRGVSLIDNRQQVVLQDEIKATSNLDAWWFMHTDASVQVSADGRSAVLTKQGKQMLVRILGAAPTAFSLLPAQPLPSSPQGAGQATNAGFQRLAIHVTGVPAATISVQFTPLRTGQTVPPVESSTPLSSWTTGGTSSELSGLTLGGTPITAFSPGTLTYDSTAAPDSAVPQIGATAPAGSQVSISQAVSVPGRATVSVSQAGKAPSTYSVFIGKGSYEISGVTATASVATAKSTYDGDLSTKWVVGGNQSLKYDLGAVRRVAAVSISWASTGPTPSLYSVRTSSDGVAWVTQRSAPLPQSTAWATTDFAPTNARYVSVDVDSQNIATRYTGIYELKILSDAEVKGPTLTAADPESVALTKVPPTRNVGDSGTAAFTIKNGSGALLDGTKFPVQYVSSDPKVLSISASGAFSALSRGTARVGVMVTAPNRRVIYDSAAVVVSDPWSTSIAPSGDTYVHGSIANAGVNYGSSAGLLVKQTPWADINRETYMAFDLSAYRGKKIVSASLTFYANTSDSGGTLSHTALHEITTPWAEMLVTYKTKPQLGKLIRSVSIDGTLAARTADVTEYVGHMAAGGLNGNIGFTQDNPPGGSGLLVFIYGKESPKKPHLDIKTAYVAPPA